jgi:DNA-binding MarR family transcriptional regulator
MPRDSVDALLASWREQRPELDFSPVGVTARLGRVRRHVAAAQDAVYARYGRAAPSFGVLVTLARIGGEQGVSQRRLMDELGLTSGTISVRMDRLVQQGLVDRRQDPESKRTTLITLTGRGRALFEQVVPAHLANERRMLAALSEHEQEALAGLLRKLLVEFEGSADPLGLGLTLAPAHAAIALRESVGLEPVPALMVRSVAPDGPAEIRTGDLLLRAGDVELRSVSALCEAAAGRDRLSLTVLRGSEERTVAVPLAARRGGGSAARGEHVV